MFLAFSVIINFMTIKNYDFYLPEGESISSKNLDEQFKIHNEKEYIIKLNEFIIQKYMKNKKTIQNYISKLTVNNDLKNIQVNNPLKIGNIKIYQKSYNLDIKEIKVIISKNEYKIDNKLKYIEIIEGETRFYITPVSLEDKKMIYYYEITYNNKSYKGKFIKNEIPSIITEFDKSFNIENEDFRNVSLLMATYKPFNILLAISSILFIFFIFYDFWGKMFLLKKIFRIKD